MYSASNSWKLTSQDANHCCCIIRIYVVCDPIISYCCIYVILVCGCLLQSQPQTNLEDALERVVGRAPEGGQGMEQALPLPPLSAAASSTRNPS